MKQFILLSIIGVLAIMNIVQITSAPDENNKITYEAHHEIVKKNRILSRKIKQLEHEIKQLERKKLFLSN